MSLKINNIESLMKELKCTQCQKLLSVLPIYYCAATGNVCGRCSTSLDWMISNGTLEKATAYEAVAKYLVFPCSNRESGCKIELKWNQVEEHEKSCTSNVLTCPFNGTVGNYVLQCAWKGGLVNLASHLLASHKNNVQVNPSNFAMNVHESNMHIFIVTVAEQKFVVVTKFLKETNKFHCVVMCCGKEPENQFYRFQLELGRYDDYFLILRKNNTEPFVDTAEIIDNYDKMINVDVSSVAAMLGNPNCVIYCKVGVSKKSKKEIAAIMPDLKISPDITKNLSSTENSAPTKNPPPSAKNPAPIVINPPPGAKNPPSGAKNSPSGAKIPSSCSKNPPPPVKIPQKPKLAKVKPTASISEASATKTDAPKIVKQLSKMDKQLLEELECPVCNNHMLPPIYICPTGHSICNDCKDKVKQCPSCRTQIMSTRNFTLEKLTTRVQYPCKYADVGCNEVLNSEFIHQHEVGCAYGSNKCPLKMLPSMCNLKNYPVDIIGHIREKHAEYIAEVNQEYARHIKATITSSYYVAMHENEIFIVCCKHSASAGPIRFNFLHVGMKKNEAKFRYELEFLDQTNKGMKLIINQLCQMVPPKVSDGLKNCLTIPLELLGPFISKTAQPTLCFKFHIERL